MIDDSITMIPCIKQGNVAKTKLLHVAGTAFTKHAYHL